MLLVEDEAGRLLCFAVPLYMVRTLGLLLADAFLIVVFPTVLLAFVLVFGRAAWGRSAVLMQG